MHPFITVEGKPNGQTLTFENYNDVVDHWYQMQEKAISWPDGRTAKYSIAVDISDLKTTQNRPAEAHAEQARTGRSWRKSCASRCPSISSPRWSA